MKPDTIELFTCLACAEAKKNIDEFVHLDAATLDSSDLRTYATICSDVISILSALENLLLTAADEAERIDIAVSEAKSESVPVAFTDNVKATADRLNEIEGEA